MRDPVTQIELLFPPGGGVEPGEAPEETARRETLEETGLRVRIDPAVREVVRYPYTWAGVEYDVTTHYFAATLDEPFREVVLAVFDAEYNHGALWVPVEEAPARMAQVIARAVTRVIERTQGR
jgi:8-oxo-dGTP pyrophosphatase MutT (NUDIX family)